MSRPRPANRTPVVVALLVAALAGLALWPWEGEPPGRAPRPALDGRAFPREVDLGDGRRVTVPAPPLAILPAAAGSVDVVCALVEPARIAALPRQGLPYSGLRDPASPYLARPTFEVYVAEPLLALAPDLVLAHDWQSDDTTARLREAGVSVVVLTDPRTWDETRAQIRTVARLLGAESRAEELLAGYDRRVAALGAAHGRLREVRALCYSNGGAGGWVAGAGTTHDELLRLAGLRNLAAETGRQGHVTVSYEELLVLDPDVFVVGGAADAQSPGGTAHLLATEPALAGLAAVRARRVLVLDSWLYTTLSQHLVDAAECLQQLALATLPPETSSGDGG